MTVKVSRIKSIQLFRGHRGSNVDDFFLNIRFSLQEFNTSAEIRHIIAVLCNIFLRQKNTEEALWQFKKFLKKEALKFSSYLVTETSTCFLNSSCFCTDINLDKNGKILNSYLSKKPNIDYLIYSIIQSRFNISLINKPLFLKVQLVAPLKLDDFDNIESILRVVVDQLYQQISLLLDELNAESSIYLLTNLEITTIISMLQSIELNPKLLRLITLSLGFFELQENKQQ